MASEYDFAGTPPWKEVVEDKDILQLTKDEMKLLEEYAGKIKSEEPIASSQ